MHRKVVKAALVGIAVLAVAAPASARTDNRSKPVVYVHGFDLFSSSDCNNWNAMDSTLRTWGLTGTKVTVQYYSNDVNCGYTVLHHGSHATHYGSSHTTHNTSTDIRHLAYHMAWMINDHFGGQTVDVVSHSMGGLITRYMIHRRQAGDAAFPSSLPVEDSVTLGSPHNGTGWAYGCGYTQCVQMRPGSSFINYLNASAQNPQGTGGTDWTLQGSDDDGIVSASSATSMTAAHKVIYLTSADVGHSDYYADTTDARTADVNYNDNGGPWYAWYDAPWSVRWSDFGMYLGTW